jgi:hypothetical protein
MTHTPGTTFLDMFSRTLSFEPLCTILRVFVMVGGGAFLKGEGADMTHSSYVVRPRLRRAEGRMKGVPIPPFAKGGGTQPKHSKLSVQQSLSSTEPALTSPSPLTRRGAAAAATSNQTPF